MATPVRDTPTRTPGARAIALVFLVIISVPALGLALGLERATISESEMRELAPWPTWSWAPRDVAAWPGAFQTYFKDHFALRARLIDWRSSILWNGLRTTSSDTVIAGKQDWLFYAADGGIEDWTQVEPFAPDELAVWREALTRRRAFLANRGIRYLFVIAPDKQMIYPEYMPDSLHRMRNDYRADQLIAYMRQTTPDFQILDLRAAVIGAKSTETLYHRYDTHWNDRGGLLGYQVIAKALQPWYPSITPLQRADFDTSSAVPSGDKTTLLGLTDPGKVAMPGLVLRRGPGYRVVEPTVPDPYGEEGLLITQHQDPSLPTAMVFRDSFAGRLIPFLSEHFSRASYFWQNELDFDNIERQKPDIVIQEFVARHFFSYLPYPGIIPK